MVGPQFNIWAVLILLGATHGVFLAIVLWFKKENQSANRIFALLLLSIAYHLFEYAINISGVIANLTHLLFTSYPLLFVIGPLFYLYIHHYINGCVPSGWKVWGHFVPAGLLLLLLLPFYLQNSAQKMDFILNVGADGFQTVPIEQFLIMGAQVTQLFVYLLLSYRMIDRQIKGAPLPRANQLKKIRWLQQTTLALLCFVVIYATFLIVLVFNKSYRVEVDYIIVLTLSLLLFAAGYAALAQPNAFGEGLSGNGRKPLLDDQVLDQVKGRLERFMLQQKPFLEEDLKISDLAEALDLPVHHLSEVINQAYQTNFSDFVNQYRIEEAKRLLADPAYRDQKILAIAFDTGFSNKGTFNRVFKKNTGKTPSAYRKAHQSGKKGHIS